MCPLTMANERGGCFARVFVVSPGKLFTKPFWRAIASVDRAGEKRDAWANATSSAGVADPTADMAWSHGGVGGVVGVGKSKCHRRVLVVRVPWRTRRCLYVTVTAVALKLTSQPASHNCPMDRRVWVARSGTIWTWRAVRGKWGKSSSATCVEYMMLPFGLRMASGVGVGRLFMTGRQVVPKWAVLPVSAIREEVGGPSDIVNLGEMY